MKSVNAAGGKGFGFSNEIELEQRIKYLLVYLFSAIVTVAAVLIYRVWLHWSLPFFQILAKVGPGTFSVLVGAWVIRTVSRNPSQRTINIALWTNLGLLLFLIATKEGFFSPYVIGIPAMAFLAGFMMSPVYSVVFMALGIIGYTLIAIGHVSGILPEPEHFRPDEGLVIAVMVVALWGSITMIVGWLFLKNFQKRGRAVEESEVKYRALVDSIPDPVFLFDSKGIILHANPNALRRFGYNPDELIGGKGAILLSDKFKRENLAKFAEDVRVKRSSVFETEVITKNREIFPVEINSSPLGDDTHLGGMVAIFRDVTGRREAEKKIRENERFLSNVFSSIQDGLSVLDKDMNVLAVNAVMEKWYAHKAPFIGKKCYDIYNDRVAHCDVCPTRETLKTGKAHNEVVQKIGPGGKLVGWLDLWAFPMLDAETGEIRGVIEYVRDITEKKLYEEAIKRSEEQYRTLAEAAQDFIFIVDSDFRVRYVNSYGAAEFGVLPEEIIGRDMRDLFPAPIWERQKNSLLRVFETGEPFFIESEAKFPGGGKWLDTKLVPIKNAKGEIESVLGVSRNVTDRKTAEERVRLLSTVVEQASEGIAVIDLDGNIIFSNNAFAAMHGYAPDELGGKHMSVFHHPEQMPFVDAAGKQILEEGSFSGEIWHMRRNGARFPSHMHNTLLRDDEGKPFGMVGAMRDITDSKLSAERLKESEQLYRSLIETSPDSILLLDLDSRIIMANKKSAEFAGFEHEADMIGISMRNRIHPDDRENENKANIGLFETGRIDNLDVRAIREDGTYYDAEVNATLLRNEKGMPRAILAITRDITERKKAERALRESEQRHRSYIETSPDAVVLFGMDFKVKMANRCAADFYGVADPSELIGVNGLDAIPVEERSKAWKEFAYHMETGKTMQQEYTLVRQDGGSFPVESTTGIIRDADGKPSGILSLIRDITDRKFAEKKLTESELHYRTLVETSPDGVLFVDSKGKIVTANSRASLLFGYEKAADMVGLKPRSLLIQEDRERALDVVRRAFETGKALDREFFGCLKPDGLSFIAEISATPIFDNDKKPLGILIVLRDVTERMLFETQLRESEERFRHLADAAIEAIVFHENGVVLEANKAALKMFGYERPDEIIGRKVFEFIRPDYHDLIKEHMAKAKSLTIEAVAIRSDGTLFHVETSAGPVIYRGRNVRMVSMHDVTARKSAEEESRKLQDKLILADRMASIGQLVLGIAHEFNNILAGMRGYAQLSLMPGKQNRLNELPPLVIELVDRAQTITENLLGFSERFTPSREMARPSEIINGILKLIRKDLELAGIKVAMKVPRDYTLKTDTGKLQQVLLNLIINARHAMPEGGTMTFNLREHDGKTTLTVEDSGVGIPTEHLPRIFDPFFTTKGALGGSKTPGTGLGLSLSYGIMQSLGGNIEVKSRPGAGSVFSVVLPREEDAPPEANA